MDDGRVEEAGTDDKGIADTDTAEDDGGGNRGINSNCVFLWLKGTSGNS